MHMFEAEAQFAIHERASSDVHILFPKIPIIMYEHFIPLAKAFKSALYWFSVVCIHEHNQT